MCFGVSEACQTTLKRSHLCLLQIFYKSLSAYCGMLIANLTTSFFSDDPYYCGLRARVPNFVNGKQGQQQGQGQPGQMKEGGGKPNSKSSNSKKGNGNQSALSPPPPSRSTPNLQNLAQLPGAAPPFWWHSRLYPDSGIGGKYFMFFHRFSREDTVGRTAHMKF